MPELTTTRLGNIDAAMPARDVGELAMLGAPIAPAADATFHDAPDASRRARVFIPWAYDFDYGWSPKRARADQRPALQLPPYFKGAFPLRTSGMAQAQHYAITIDLRPFPQRARVFLVMPTRVLPAHVVKRLSAGGRNRSVGRYAALLADKDLPQLNALFATRFTKAFSTSRCVIELAGGKPVVLTDLRLPVEQQRIDVHFAVLREQVSPKTYHTIRFEQLIDHRLMGNFDHIFQAYHNYDVPVIGDRRTMLAYRRSSMEVAKIPPMALAFFDSWQHAVALGYDFAPRSYGRHFAPHMVSDGLTQKILTFFNGKALTPKKIVERIVDNPYVDASGRAEATERLKHGIDSKTAERIIATRKRLGKLTSLAQIDAVKGVGPDTLSDIITSFLVPRVEDLEARADEQAERLARRIAAASRTRRKMPANPWQGDPQVIKWLG